MNKSFRPLFRLGFPVLETKQETVRPRYAGWHQRDAIARLDYRIIRRDGFAIDEYHFDAFHGNVQLGQQLGAGGFTVQRESGRVRPLAFSEDVCETHEGV
jgi:hypothetical protein